MKNFDNMMIELMEDDYSHISETTNFDSISKIDKKETKIPSRAKLIAKITLGVVLAYLIIRLIKNLLRNQKNKKNEKKYNSEYTEFLIERKEYLENVVIPNLTKMKDELRNDSTKNIADSYFKKCARNADKYLKMLNRYLKEINKKIESDDTDKKTYEKINKKYTEILDKFKIF